LTLEGYDVVRASQLLDILPTLSASRVGIPIITDEISWLVEQPYFSEFPPPSSESSHPQALLSECPSVVELDLAML
jgi:hypothetical protein